MAASLTLTSPVIAADGKTLTATIAGGTGTGLALGSAANIVPHLTAGNAYGLNVSSASVSGTTLTVNLMTPAGSGDAMRIDFPASVTLTDDGGNTPTGQSNLTVTNNSAVTVTTVDPWASPTLFEINGLIPAAAPSNNPPWWTDGVVTGSSVGDAVIEFVTDATEVAALTYSGVVTKWRTDGATSDSTITGIGFWSAKALTTSPLAAGKHLFLLHPGQYFYGVRISGGTRTMSAVQSTKRTITANTFGAPHIPAATNVTPWGTRKTLTAANGSVTVGQSYESLELDFQTDATTIEIATQLWGAWACSVDGAFETLTTDTLGNVNGYFPVGIGNPVGTHTIKATYVGSGGTTTMVGVRLLKGTKVTTASLVSDTTIKVADTTYLAVNDWVKIDKWSKREWRQVTAITGPVSGEYTLTVAALGIAHAIGVQVTSFSAPAATCTTWVAKDLSGKRLVGMGDSNTEGANDYGIGGTPDANGVSYATYDPRWFPGWIAAQRLNIEVVNLGIQGTDTINQAGRAGDFAGYGVAADFVTIWEGTNDINSNTTTPTQYHDNIQTQITAAAAILKPGGKILLLPPTTPTGVTSAKGLSLAVCLTQLQTLAAANPTTCILISDLGNGLVAGDLSGVHLHVSGQAKVANNLAPYIGGTPATSSFAAA